ncbi:hypothetical protein R2F61_05270 [Mollicutes bacterium LVI A0078]|nr:hypothetical protein RZE84_05290 [Mollicutes bacterium LVI A0075]WOO90139.1 hypothetical protein R2F61_05270 [Mollicutes bacterium LVI A0078]
MKNYEDMSKRERRVHNQLMKEPYTGEKQALWLTAIISGLSLILVFIEPLYLPYFVLSLVFAWSGYLIASRLNSYAGEGIAAFLCLFASKLLIILYFALMFRRYRRNKYLLKLQSEQ